ncbi:hypothetical protein, partial [Vibrio harveyi]|uniref:hypothetical protein n=1 Tax=Vibrio harveyi TaxID=669 RepID=UPI0018F220E5
ARSRGLGDVYKRQIWVCIRTDMPSDAREALDSKCSLISDWAMAQGVEANFFLIDENRFRDNFSEAMTGENCGCLLYTSDAADDLRDV